MRNRDRIRPRSLELKRSIYSALETIVPAKTIIASNTSRHPIMLLQAGRVGPSRYIGMHWGEPAQIMRYLEVVRENKRTRRPSKRPYALASRVARSQQS